MAGSTTEAASPKRNPISAELRADTIQRMTARGLDARVVNSVLNDIENMDPNSAVDPRATEALLKLIQEQSR